MTQNSGQNWLRVGNNMPVCPVYDMEWDLSLNRLVAGTHARSIQTFPMDSLIDFQVIIGLAEPATDVSIKLYPNPAHDYVVLEQEMTPGNLTQWDVLNLKGQTVMSGAQTQPVQRINVEILPSGLYFLRTKSGTQTSTAKFIKH